MRVSDFEEKIIRIQKSLQFRKENNFHFHLVLLNDEVRDVSSYEFCK